MDGLHPAATPRVGMGIDLLHSDAHFWVASLDRPASELQSLEEVLSADERERARRFQFERDRRRYTAARGILREILARYLGTSPRLLEFSYGARGKPALAGDSVGDLRFNLSHSQALAVYAFTLRRAVGVDVERVRLVEDAEEIARRYFAREEWAALNSVAPDLRPEAFLCCWTRKEAYIKAIGDGLALPLDDFVVSLKPGEPARLLEVRGRPGAAARWLLFELMPAPGFVGALAVEGPEVKLTRIDY